VIRASELGEYAFCARSWWLGRVLGYRSANVAEMQAGQVNHRAHGRDVERAYRVRRAAVGLLLLAGLALAAALVLVMVH
jgi:hypothetical protein